MWVTVDYATKANVWTPPCSNHSPQPKNEVIVWDTIIQSRNEAALDADYVAEYVLEERDNGFPYAFRFRTH